MGWVFPKYDLIVVDECQDMNLPQLMVALGALAPSGRMCVVGDDWQAIYGFRGAAEDGLDMMKARLQAQEIGLTVTRRCGRVIVESAKENGPQDYQSAEGAHEGELANISENLLVPSLQVGDVVLSRSNAPLMPLCLSLLKKGTPGRIRGRDIGKQLSGLVKKMKAKSVPQFLSKITSWGEDQKNRFKGTKAAESMSEQINDQVATLVAVASGCVNVNEICDRIENIFQDEKGFNKPCVWFSSTHKAKGLEWDRVFLIRRTYRPERQGEEARLFYVAQTRAKHYLCFVHEPSKRPEDN
jgi:superfamily I DNA/RNA helicase